MYMTTFLFQYYVSKYKGLLHLKISKLGIILQAVLCLVNFIVFNKIVTVVKL